MLPLEDPTLPLGPDVPGLRLPLERPETPGLPISSTLNATPRGLPESAIPMSTRSLNALKNPEFLAGLAAIAADAMRETAGKPATSVKQMAAFQALRRSQATEERKATTEQERLGMEKERLGLDALRYRMDVGKFIASKNKDDIETVGRFLDYGKKLKDQGVSPDVADAALRGVAEQSGLEFLKPLAPALAKNLDVTAQLGPMYQLIKDEPGAALFLMNAHEAIQKNPSEFFDRVSQFASRVAARRIVERLPATVAALKEASGGHPIPLESVAKAMSVDAPYLGTVLRGTANMTEDVRKVIEQVLTTQGVQTVAAGAKLAEAKALIPVKAEEAKATEEATRPGREKFAADIEAMKQRMEAGKFPEKKEQATLRDRYRAVARAELGPPDVLIKFGDEEDRKAFGDQIERRAVELAHSDGLGFVFPSKKTPAEAPKPSALPADLPDVIKNRGAILRDPATGKRYTSDGKTWTEVK